jgi:DNA-binding beta-propeller fold protein YncE
MKRALVMSLSLALFGTTVALVSTQKPWSLGWNSERTKFKLANGWTVSPVGQQVALPGDMPTSLVVTPDGKWVLVNTSGYNDHTLNVIEVSTGRLVDSAKVNRSSFGLALVAGKVVSSGGRSDGSDSMPDMRTWDFDSGKLKPSKSWTLSETNSSERFVTAILPTRGGFFVANAQSDEVLRLSEDGKMVRRRKVGYRPHSLALSPDGKTLAVSEWGDRGVILLDPVTLETRTRFETQAHPTSLAYHPDGRLFVSESGADTVIQFKDGEIVRTLVSMERVHPIGPNPFGLTVSPNGKTLFVALAGENAVAVVDVSTYRPKVSGHIPTPRWPSAVATTPDGKRLIIASAKGFSGPSAVAGKEVPNQTSAKEQMQGQVSILDVPNPAELKRLTKLARQNFPLGNKGTRLSASDQRAAMTNLKKIKHVIYVIKENKTYDQVLGDLAGTNGDPSLTLFGEPITPNIHALSREYVTFDRLFTDAESSQVGHQWSGAAFASEYTETQWTSNYGDKGELTSDSRLTASPGEYLWSNARKQGLWARVYGEYVDVQEDHNSLNDAMKGDPEKYGYAAEWEKVFARDGRDTEKMATFLTELAEFERTGKMPSLIVMALPDDHTNGYRAGSFSPKAMVADNDRAVGQLIEALSKSRFWEETAVFIIQDDTQGAIDHVDSHRTYGLVISPWTNRGMVDSTPYTTSSFLRTMGMILGLPALSSYDANAVPVLRPFLGPARPSRFACRPAPKEHGEINPSGTKLAKRSEELGVHKVDAMDDEAFNQLLWAGERPGVPYPRR